MSRKKRKTEEEGEETEGRGGGKGRRRRRKRRRRHENYVLTPTLFESTHKGVNQSTKDITKTQQKPESPTVPLTFHPSKYEGHKPHQRYILKKDAPPPPPPPPTPSPPFHEYPRFQAHAA